MFISLFVVLLTYLPLFVHREDDVPLKDVDALSLLPLHHNVVMGELR
jgi:hypothetical protein